MTALPSIPMIPPELEELLDLISKGYDPKGMVDSGTYNPNLTWEDVFGPGGTSTGTDTGGTETGGEKVGIWDILKGIGGVIAGSGSGPSGSSSSSANNTTLDKILNILKTGAGIAGSLGGIASSGAGIASLFQPSAAGISKEQATSYQQGFESAANSIEQAVNSGSMDVETAINLLNRLKQELWAGSTGSTAATQIGGTSTGSNYVTQGAAMAGITIDRILANLQMKRATQISAPLKTDTGAPVSASGGLEGQPTMIAAQTKNAVLNKLMGMPAGNRDLAGSPIGSAIDSMSVKPMDRFKEIAQTAPGMFPLKDSGIDAFRQQILKRLGG